MELYPHQKNIVKLSGNAQNLALLWECGTGKTGGLVGILKKKYRKEKIVPTLIFAPLVVISNWRAEFKKFSNIDSHLIHIIDGGTSLKRVKQIEQALKYTRNQIIIINYEAVQNQKIYDILYNWRPEIVVADEMHLLKNHKSKRAKKIIKIADRAEHRYGLTGTPILNSVEDIYNQYRFLDGGKTFGRDFWVFKNTYMYDENAAWSHRPGGYAKYVPRPEMFKELNDKIYSIATRITKKECLKDLPPLVKIQRTVELSKEQRKYYNEMKRDFITFIKDKRREGVSKAVVAQLAITKALRLQQIVSGFVTTEDGEVIEIKDNPRLTECENLLAELTPKHKVIVWCSFIKDYQLVSRICQKLKIEHVFIIGQQKIQEKQDAMDRFSDDNICRVMVANRRAGGIGINLVAASYSIVYSRAVEPYNIMPDDTFRFRQNFDSIGNGSVRTLISARHSLTGHNIFNF